MRCVAIVAALSSVLCVSAPLWAQEEGVEKDILISYELGEVFVDDGRRVSEIALQRIPLAAWHRADVLDVAEAGRLVSSAHVRTNSRGETLITLRGSTDRQVPVYLDGVPLTTPWDQRVDLSLLPAGVVGGAEVTKGSMASRVAANGYGGAVNLLSRDRSFDGRTLESNFQMGTGGRIGGGLTWLERRGKWSTLLAFSNSLSDGHSLPEGIGLPFSQPDSTLRTNTDFSLRNLFVRGSYSLTDATRIGATFMSISGDKGVAPESHIDPATDGVRYWRYPEWTYDVLHLTGRTTGFGARLNLSAWGGWANQEIHQFTDQTYSELSDVEYGSDTMYGARLSAERDLGGADVYAFASFQNATHQQELIAITQSGETPVGTPRFSESRGTLGFSSTVAAFAQTEASLSLGGDILWGHEAGPNEVPGSIAKGFGSLELSRTISSSVALFGSIGRRSRFPSMRERYDDALGRFEINPDLDPETAWLFDLGTRIRSGFSSLDATLFARRERGTIQTQVNDGVRTRINLGGSSAYGVELNGAVRPLQQVSFQGHLTLLRSRGFTDSESDLIIAETPGILGWLEAEARPIPELTLVTEVEYTGGAFSEVDSGLTRLDPALQLHLRVGYNLQLPITGYSVEVYGRVNNLTDRVVLQQAGLPGPGRTWVFGLSASLN